MKKLMITLTFILSLTIVSMCQIVQVDNTILTVRDKVGGKIIAKKEIPGIYKTAAGNGIIVITTIADFIEVTNKNLVVLSTDKIPNIEFVSVTTNANCLSTSASIKPKPIIIIYYKDGKIEYRDTKLNVMKI